MTHHCPRSSFDFNLQRMLKPQPLKSNRLALKSNRLEWQVFRVCISLITLPYVTYASIAGMLWVTLSLRWQRGGVGIDGVTHAGVLAIAGLLLLTCGFAVDRAEALLQLTNFLPFLFFFAVLPILVKTTEQLEKIALSLVIAAVPLNAIAFLEYLLRNLTLPHYLRRLPLIRWIRARPHAGRAMVFFEHPNWLANFLVLIFGLGLGLLWCYTIRAKMRGETQKKSQEADIQSSATEIAPAAALHGAQSESRDQNESSTQRKPRARSLPLSCLYLATVLNLLGIFSSGSRNGLIVAISQLILFLLLTKADRRILTAGLLGLLGLGASVTVWGIGGRALSIVEWLDDPRVRQWKIAIDMAIARPGVGWGLGNYKFVMPDRLLALDPTCELQRAYIRPIPGHCEFVMHPHNVWLLLASEAGVVVTLILTLFIGSICYRAMRLFLSQQLGAIDQAILLAYLLSFWGCIAFGCFDVTLYDARINVLNWTLLAGLYQMLKLGLL